MEAAATIILVLSLISPLLIAAVAHLVWLLAREHAYWTAHNLLQEELIKEQRKLLAYMREYVVKVPRNPTCAAPRPEATEKST